jgi:hypothetical protein
VLEPEELSCCQISEFVPSNSGGQSQRQNFLTYYCRKNFLVRLITQVVKPLPRKYKARRRKKGRGRRRGRGGIEELSNN